MTEADLFYALLGGAFLVVVVVAVLLQFISAPYGRHDRVGWGPAIPATAAWVVMELPAVLIPLACAVASPDAGGVAGWVLLALCTALLLGRWALEKCARKGWSTCF